MRVLTAAIVRDLRRYVRALHREGVRNIVDELQTYAWVEYRLRLHFTTLWQAVYGYSWHKVPWPVRAPHRRSSRYDRDGWYIKSYDWRRGHHG